MSGIPGYLLLLSDDLLGLLARIKYITWYCEEMSCLGLVSVVSSFFFPSLIEMVGEHSFANEIKGFSVPERIMKVKENVKAAPC